MSCVEEFSTEKVAGGGAAALKLTKQLIVTS